MIIVASIHLEIFHDSCLISDDRLYVNFYDTKYSNHFFHEGAYGIMQSNKTEVI